LICVKIHKDWGGLEKQRGNGYARAMKNGITKHQMNIFAVAMLRAKALECGCSIPMEWKSMHDQGEGA
jgi:hypothetical protein